MKELLFQAIKEAKTIGISGHIRPDGDCVGSSTALYEYVQETYNQNQIKTIDLYLESVQDSFSFLKGAKSVQTSYPATADYDLFIALDCGSSERLGAAEPLFKTAAKSFNIDHHISNQNYGTINIIVPDASSTCEILYGLFDDSMISMDTAESLYLGIVHDTGVFKHSNTKRRTMEIAGALIEKGIDTSKIIDGTFYEKTHLQNQILGRCLMESMLLLEGKIIIASIGNKLQEFYNSKSSDYDGIIDQLRITKGVEVAILLVEMSPRVFKVSMRSNGVVDVNSIAAFFGGGGHIKAAGCTMSGTFHDIINNLTIGIEHQLNKNPE